MSIKMGRIVNEQMVMRVMMKMVMMTTMKIMKITMMYRDMDLGPMK